jgi:hypothetical protein
MTVQKDEIQLQRVELVKTLRSRVRLKHSLAADRELNEVLPKAEKKFDKLVHQGKVLDQDDIEKLVSKVVS